MSSVVAAAAPSKPVVLVPFVCPVCAGPTAVSLIELSRKSGMTCPSCQKWLRQTDVMRAMHAPRKPRAL